MENKNALTRLKIIKNHLNTKKKYIDCAYSFLDLDSFLTKEEQKLRMDIRNYLEKNITHNLIPYLEKEELPLDLIKKFNKEFSNIIGLSFKGYGSPALSSFMKNVVLLELGRCDPSLFLFCIVQSEVVAQTIYELGSEEHKDKYLKGLFSLDLIGCFCLTEKEVGSDAGNLQTVANKVENGYVINGNKRWIGSATLSDVFIVWAKNSETNQINGFLIDKKEFYTNNLYNGKISTKKIEGKLSVRSVQNADIIFENVFVPEKNKLKGQNFAETTGKILIHSRLGISWGAVGISMGAYDRAIKYAISRKQFGKPIGSFQLIQEKLSIMMSNIQAMAFLCKRANELYDQGLMSVGKCGMVKAWTTAKCRENVALAREIFGGNGMLIENWVIKALADTEALFTLEGSYDVNLLACGRELTGISAFK